VAGLRVSGDGRLMVACAQVNGRDDRCPEASCTCALHACFRAGERAHIRDINRFWFSSGI
jgi:hypothetical protein